MLLRRWNERLPLLVAPLALVLAGCHSSNDSSGASVEAVAAQVDGVLNIGYNTIGADAVAALFFDGDPTNDPFVLDTREAADYALGHIPGAVNVPLFEFPDRYLAEGAALIPADRNVVVASYVGGDGNMASLLINCVRIADTANSSAYPWSKTIMMGMQAWTFDKALANDQRFPDDLGVTRVEAATETTANAGGSFGRPSFDGVNRDPVAEAILQRAANYLGNFSSQFELQTTPLALQTLLDNANPDDDPQVLSVRGAADYGKGHIPGAVNLAWKSTADLSLVTMLDPTKPVVAYCYTGHTGSLATMALGILGYDATNMMYGMCGWNPVAAVNASQLNGFDLNRGWDFPIDDGSPGDLGDLALYAPPSGCSDCHTSLTALVYDLTVDPLAAAPTAPSSGEG